MPDLATLGIKVDSRDLKVADKDLDKLAQTAGKTEKATDELGKSADETNKRFSGLSTAISATTISMASLVAAGAGIFTMVGNLGRASREIDNLSKLSNVSTDQFQRMAFASETFGISQEKLADILKDTQDKVGDFMQSGGGAMADFFENIAPKVGVTADQFRNLSGADALQLYYSSLEKANLSQSDMVFYLEAIASDSAMLQPLLENNGQALSELGDKAKQYGLILSDDVIYAAKEYDKQLNLLQSSLKGQANTLAAEMLPALTTVVQALTETTNGSSALQTASDALAWSLQGLVKVGFGVASTFELAGIAIGGTAAAAVAAAQGQFSQARDIISMMMADIDAAALKTAGRIDAVGAGIGAAPARGSAATGFGTSAARAKKDAEASKPKQEALTVSQLAVIEAAKIYEETRTPLEKLNAAYAELNKLQSMGAFGDGNEIYVRAIKQVQEEFDKATKAVDAWDDSMVKTVETASTVDTALINSFESAADAIADFAMGGKASVSDMVNSMIRDFIKLELRMQMMSMYKSVGGFGGIMASLFGVGVDSSFTTGLGSAATSGAMDYAAMSFDGGGYTGGGNRTGGVDGKGGFPAILHPNETVIDHAKGQTGGVSVSITINSDGTGRQESSDGNQAMQLGRSIEASVMSVIMREKRPGGMLA